MERRHARPTVRSVQRVSSGSRASIVPRSHRPSKRCPLSNDSCPHARTWRRYVCKGRVSYAQERRRERRADKRKAEEKLEGCQDPRGVRNEGRRTDRGARGPLGVDSGWGVLWMPPSGASIGPERAPPPRSVRTLVAYLASLVPSEAQLSSLSMHAYPATTRAKGHMHTAHDMPRARTALP